MEENKPNNNPYQEEESIDLRKLFNYFIGNLHWFILSVGFALTIGFLLNRYTTRIYSASTTVLIEDENKGKSMMSSAQQGLDLTQGFSLFPGLQNLENQTIILKSYSQVRKTINSLDFNVSYFHKGYIREVETYKSSPFEVIYNTTHVQPLGLHFNIIFDNENQISIDAKGEGATLFNYGDDVFLNRVGLIEFSTKIKPGERVVNDYCDFQIRINKNFNPSCIQSPYFFFFQSPHTLALDYNKRLTVAPMSKGSSMVKISLTDQCPAKAVDFLNQFTAQYLNRNLDKKNEFANNTIRFIDMQLDTISKSLGLAEDDLQNFQSKNRVMDLSLKTQQVFEQMQNLENQKMQLEMQKKYYEYILSYIEQNQDIESVLAPSAMGVQDPLLNQLILEINRLSVEKSSLTNIKKGTDFGPLQALDAQIRNAKKNITENATNLVKSAEISLGEIRKRIAILNENIKDLPESERQLFQIKRKFSLNDNLYTFLLERQSEAQILKASNTSDNEIIDSAMLDGGPIKPKTMINYMIALMLGFLFPAGFIAIKEYFKMRIDSPDMVRRLTTRPIIGYIPNSLSEANENIFDNLDSPWAEAFRIVRTKLEFFIKTKPNPIIMVTSSIPGEGKTFIALNLASAYSLINKKTVLVGMDLRRPQIAQRFNIDKTIGFSNYMIGGATLEEIIQKTDNPNFDIIASGAIPPNPAELIADEKTVEFFNLLKTRYDYIILDTAPISPVSDSHHLATLVDIILFVIRDRYTHKLALENSLEEFNSNHVKNVCLLMNDIKMNRKKYGSKYGYSYGYRYGYKYGYSYGYGYSEDDGKKKRTAKARKNKAVTA
jgi:tyrosine-protein kinase Etk/Wzc